jgi:ferric-dicitrate binding protein FerR (iron transport regulator)
MNLFEAIKTGTRIGKYITGKESREESGQLQAWLKEDPVHQKLFEQIKNEKKIAEAVTEFDARDKEYAWKRYLEQVTALSLQKVLFRWKIAAVFFFVVGCAGILAYFSVKSNLPVLDSSEKLYTTVSTNAGQNSKIVLPDSSVIWLNSGTTLSYNTDFSLNNREIRLQGQAFFQIARNEKVPLFVAINGFKIKVLGTKFDVSAYPEDPKIDVVLESGSVELLHEQDQSFDHILKPGEKAEFDLKTKNVSISPVNVYKYTSWKDGVLIFENAPMDEVLEKLERWYNIRIEVKDQKIYGLVFNATIINENVDEIFDLIRYTCSVNYQIIPSKNPEFPVKVILTY